MSLINEQQKKNAGVKNPVIKPPKTAPVSPTEGLTPEPFTPDESLLPNTLDEPAPPAPQADAGFSVEPEPETPQPQTSEASLPDINLLPIAPVEVAQPPEPTIMPTLPIWRDTSEEFGAGAGLRAEVANTMFPSFSVQTPDNSGTLNQAFSSFSTSANAFNNQAREQYAAAQQAQAKVQARGALPNTPDATKHWSAAPLGFLSDVLFGSEKGRKQAEAGIIDPSNASFGRAGAGMGGQIKYALNVLPSLFVGAVGEATAAVSNGLQSLGVKKETAEGFARDGFLTFLPDNIGGGSGYKGVGTTSLRQGGLNVGALKPSRILNFNFDEANKRNLLLDAIAGDPLNDVNDPTGAVKYGRIYTREQRKEGMSATQDPVGLALQIGTYLFNPGEIPGDRLISAGVGKLFSAFKKPATEVIFAPDAKVNLPALPSSTMRSEAKLAQEANRARTTQAGRQIFNTPTPSNPNFGFDLSELTEEQTRRLNLGTPRLNGVVDPELPLLPPSSRVDVGEAVLEPKSTATNTYDFNEDLSTFEPYVEFTAYPNKPYAANPQSVKRAYTGSTEVVESPLPPVFQADEVPDVSARLVRPTTVDEVFGEADDFGGYLPYSTPAKTALEIGIGNPNIQLDKAGALAIRPLDEVLETLREVNPKLLDGFDGGTWADFKMHMSQQLPDIGRVSAVGEVIPKTRRPVKQVTMRSIRDTYAEWEKTDVLAVGGVNLFAKPQEKVKFVLGDSTKVQNLGGLNVVTKANTSLFRDFTEGLPEAVRILEDYGFDARSVDVAIDDALEGARYYPSKDLITMGDYYTKEDVRRTFLHEFAHHLEEAIKRKGKEGHNIYESFVNNPIVKKSFPTEYARRKRYQVYEHWAEAVAEYLNNTQAFKQKSPEYAALVDESLGKVKGLLDTKTVEIKTPANSLANDFLALRSSQVADTEDLTNKYIGNLSKSGISPKNKDALNRYLVNDLWSEPQVKQAFYDEALKLTGDEELAKRYADLQALSKQSVENIDARDELAFLLNDLKNKYPGARDTLSEFSFRGVWSNTDVRSLVERKFDELLNTAPTTKPLTEDDLLTAAEELARHKLSLSIPLQRLDELFDETVDFGRKTVDDVPYDVVDEASVMKAIENGGITKLAPKAFDDADEVGRALVDGDFDTAIKLMDKKGVGLSDEVAQYVKRSNEYIEQANRVAPIRPNPDSLANLKTKQLYHGTALDSWIPPSNLYVDGSRGELGGGTYLTTDRFQAMQYAKARVGDNVNPKTYNNDINPTVVFIDSQFEKTLNATKALPKEQLKSVFNDLPEPILKKFTAALNKKRKPQSFVDLKALMEDSIVKAGVEPTEDLLHMIDADISKNLRALGYDSVYDKNSRFFLSLDNSKIRLSEFNNVANPSLMESTIARYNVDAEAAKHFPNYLSTDANLRDSTYKTLAQTSAEVDKKLASVQDEIIKRGLPEQDTILPKIVDESPKPQSFTEIADELIDESPCGI